MLTMEYLSDILTGNEMTEAKAMEIPAVAASVEYIGNKVALAPVYLYSKEKDGIRKVENDKRVHLLNEEPSNLFDSVLFRKMMVKDYLLHGVCYAYKKWWGIPSRNWYMCRRSRYRKHGQTMYWIGRYDIGFKERKYQSISLSVSCAKVMMASTQKESCKPINQN